MTYPDEPGHQGDETSMEAAFKQRGEKRRMYWQIIMTILHCHGSFTANELYQMLRRELGDFVILYTIAPRCSELRRMGFIQDSGVRRKTQGGNSSATVWEVREEPGLDPNLPMTKVDLREEIARLHREIARLRALVPQRDMFNDNE